MKNFLKSISTLVGVLRSRLFHFFKITSVSAGSLHFRLFIFQILVVCSVVAVIAFLISNMIHNIQVRGIKTGFDFLGEISGFGISFSLIEYSERDTYARTYLVGLINTIFVSVFGILFAAILGFLVGVARLSKNWLMQKLMVCYIEIFRNLPVLLQILFWNFLIKSILPKEAWQLSDNIYLGVKGLVVPHVVSKNLGMTLGDFALIAAVLVVVLIVTGALYMLSRKKQEKTGKGLSWMVVSAVMFVLFTVGSFVLFGRFFALESPEKSAFGLKNGFVFVPEIFVLVVALGVYTSSFVAESVRSGIMSVDVGQREAALALGLRSRHVLNKIVMPQAMTVIIPPCISHFLTLTKGSSLAMAIGFPDLTSVFAGTTLNQVGQAIEIMFVTMFTYLFLSIAVSVFLNWYNARIKLAER